jgi:hypothetical protein
MKKGKFNSSKVARASSEDLNPCKRKVGFVKGNHLVKKE